MEANPLVADLFSWPRSGLPVVGGRESVPLAVVVVGQGSLVCVCVCCRGPAKLIPVKPVAPHSDRA